MPNEFPYDVFLSHSAKDKAVVRPLAERLRRDGLKVWFDEWVKIAGGQMAGARRRIYATAMDAPGLWLVLAEIRAMPPTTAQRLKERRGVSKAIGLSLNEVHRGLLVCLFRG